MSEQAKVMRVMSFNLLNHCRHGITFWMVGLFFLLGCDECQKEGNMRCISNSVYICEQNGIESPLKWYQKADCGAVGAICKLEKDVEIIETEWKETVYFSGSENADINCVFQNKFCSDIGVPHCGAESFAYKCVLSGTDTIAVLDRMYVYGYDGVCVDSDTVSEFDGSTDTTNDVGSETDLVD